MDRDRIVPFVISVLFVLWLAACNMPGLGAPPTPFPSSENPNVAYTAAAETIIVQLTQVSNPATPTPPLVSEDTPFPSATPGLVETENPLPEATAEPVVETATPAVEPSPTVEQVPTATFTAGDPRAGLGEATWIDSFNRGDNWYLYNDEYAAFEVQGGDLMMTSYTTGSRNAWMLTVPQPINYYLEVVATTQDCEGLDRYGVIFRSDGNTGYLFAISCDGRYSFRWWNGRQMTVLVEWTESQNILTGSNQTNRLGLRAEGSQFSLYANGALLTQVSDASSAEGGFGLFLGADSTEDFQVRVSEVAYWELP